MDNMDIDKIVYFIIFAECIYIAFGGWFIMNMDVDGKNRPAPIVMKGARHSRAKIKKRRKY